MIAINKKILSKMILVMFFIISYYSIADNQIYKIEINPLNRAIIYFSENIPQYSSDLTVDKRKIILRLKSANISESLRETKANGIIQSIYINKYGNDIEINILMKEKRGFSSVYLPYSNAIMIETFDWSKVTNADDNYYSGLIAFNDNLFSASIKYFKTAEKENHTNSIAFAGLINLMEANIDQAEMRLLNAEKANSNINDIYAALSHLYKLKNNNDLSDKYKNIFIQKTGLKSFKYINIGQIKSTEINTDSSLSLLDKNLSNLDQIQNIPKDTLKKADSVSRVLTNQITEKTNSNDSFYAWLVKVLTYIGIFLAVFLVLLVIFYFKWRNSQMKLKLKLAESIKKDQNEIRLKKAKAAHAKPGTYQTSTRNAANIYKKNEDVLRIQKPHSDETFKNINEIKQLALEIIESKNSIDLDGETLEEHLKNEENAEVERSMLFINEKAKSETNEENENNGEVIDEIANIDSIPSDIDNEDEANSQINSKYEFAMHLQKETQKIKEEKIKKIALIEDDETDPEKLAELAKNTGLEKAAIETKLNITELQTDENLLSKLSEKFSVKK